MGQFSTRALASAPTIWRSKTCTRGFTLFHQFHLEGLRFAARGEKRGYALDLYETDIGIEGPNPVSPSGGNNGNGRTRWWNDRDIYSSCRGHRRRRSRKKPRLVSPALRCPTLVMH